MPHDRSSPIARISLVVPEVTHGPSKLIPAVRGRVPASSARRGSPETPIVGRHADCRTSGHRDRERRRNPSRLALAGAHYRVDLASRQRAAIEHRIEHLPRFRRQKAEPNFFFGPDTDTRLQAGGFDKALHNLQTELVHDFFEGFALGARANVHVKVLYGRSSHHHVEAVFKAFARALRVACAKDRRLAKMLPSTKGLL